MRQQLAAYRRDEWSYEELATLTEHLRICAACRQLEASFRSVGEHVRQLPTIVPSPAFREAVFAAIRADEQRLAPSVARLSRATTNPALPVVRPGGRNVRPRPMVQPSARAFQPRIFVAAAAVLLISVFSLHLLSSVGLAALGKAATSLAPVAPIGANSHASAAHMSLTRYAVEPRYGPATSALATGAWLAYAAGDAAHGSMLFTQRRQSRKSIPLFATALASTLTVRALTTHWVVWSSNDDAANGSWALHASYLSDQPGAVATTLLASGQSPAAGVDPLTRLSGLWANESMLLVAADTSSGASELLRIQLPADAATAATITVLAHPAKGHELTDPSSVNGAYYWGDVWYDGASGLHGAVWRGDTAGHAAPISSDQNSFHPVTMRDALAWVSVQSAASADPLSATPPATADGTLALVEHLHGALLARSLSTGKQWQVSARADATNMQGSGPLLLWHDATQAHVYDVQAQRPVDISQQVVAPTFAGVTASAIVWAQSAGTLLAVYDNA